MYQWKQEFNMIEELSPVHQFNTYSEKVLLFTSSKVQFTQHECFILTIRQSSSFAFKSFCKSNARSRELMGFPKHFSQEFIV